MSPGGSCFFLSERGVCECDRRARRRPPRRGAVCGCVDALLDASYDGGAAAAAHTLSHMCYIMAARHAAAAVERTVACYMQLLYNAVHRRGQ